MFTTVHHNGAAIRPLLKRFYLPHLLVILVAVVAPVQAQQVIDGGTTETVPGTRISPWNIGNPLYIGDSGIGTLIITNNGVVSNTYGYVGRSAGSNGTVMVEGADATWANSAGLIVGNSGVGMLDIADSGAVTSSSGQVGYQSGSTGTVYVEGDSSWMMSSSLSVGINNNSVGTLNISDGGAVSSTSDGTALSIGTNAGSQGTINVDGAGSILNVAGPFALGRGGAGTLNITNGGTVSATTTLNNSGSLVGSVSIAYDPTGNGKVTVDGPDSTWTNTGTYLVVGLQGTASMSITNGGVVSSTTGYIGSNAGSTGTVTVDGADSAWTNSYYLYIASAGHGSLTLSNKGLVTAANMATSAAGGIGFINIGAAQGDAATAPGTLASPTVNLWAPSSLIFNHTSADYVFGPQIARDGKVFQIAGTTTLTNANTYSGTTDIESGTLRAGSVDSFSPNSAVTLASGGTLDLAGLNQTVASLSHAGQIHMGNSTVPDTFTTLTVNGTYTGNGGTIAMNTVLNEGDANSQSDVLVVDSLLVGSSPTRLAITPTGTGDQTQGDGILVVKVENGAAAPSNTFQLAAPLIIGDYEYTLHQGGVGSSNPLNWYLRSTRESTVMVTPIRAMNPATLVLLALGLSGMAFWQKRRNA